MVKPRSKGTRVVALAVAAMLISGGAAGLTAGNHQAAATISSAVAILGGLVMLRIAAARPGKS
ncbi:hypothetical protein ACIOD2_14810 [Amycolatopsis sp. NPDC088138]|uniref:hypothetical protein n=1 Tax=Amycolatopsis sp. NPDC088138 TaxID=3363938 RepID=UPI0037F1D08C